MSIIWSVMIIISITYALFTGGSNKIIDIITKSTISSVENIMMLAGMLCFWTGIFNILKNTKVVNKMADVVKKPIKLIFKSDEIDDEIIEDVALNVTSNAIGIGNAATAFGLNAMNKMQKKNKYKEKPNDTMTMFVLLNTASIQIIPTSIISLRMIYGSDNAEGVILPVFIVSVAAIFAGIVVMKILNKVIK